MDHDDEVVEDPRQARVERARSALSEALSADIEPAGSETGRQAVVAIRPEAWARLKESVRGYAMASRAAGEQLQPLLTNLMDLIRDSPLGRVGLARLASELAQWCIDAYYEEPGVKPPSSPRATLRRF